MSEKRRRIHQLYKKQDGRSEHTEDDPFTMTKAEVAAALYASPSVVDKLHRKGRLRRMKKVRLREEEVYYYHVEDVGREIAKRNGRAVSRS